MLALLSFVTPERLAYYAIAINFAAFAAFGADKMLAEARRRRISEATLLRLALVGGSPGAYAARHLFRHKTRKQPFSSHLHAVAAGQIVLAGMATWKVMEWPIPALLRAGG